MSLFVFFAVLGAALLHAGWNAIIKTGGNKQTTMMIFTVWQGLIGLLALMWFPLPTPEVWPWLIASGVIHMFYQLFLAYAYEQGDLSRVYPISRGSAPLIVLVVGAVLLDDIVTPVEYLGVAVLGLGIVTMASGAFSSGENRKLIPYALGAACATAGYTLVDGIGARINGNPFAYVGWILFMSGIFFIPAAFALKGWSVAVAPWAVWRRGIIPAGASLAAYAIVVWAMTQAPIALVAALRETSILFAVLIGWLAFGEKMNVTKALAALLIVCGVILTRI
ncbi:EamA-like transporter family protein [Cognatiyoonia koreensis]|uniref:EamA-like transporter family protein n=1 Tax=Cognatiyoonia koreensis TaxID=364200 RepID=A0A1I0MKR2_9RHOB|nr:EamA family transporter [Cognatiyoonia koreensis]SEV88921.1 EamA-like transporter family protein [Cognatiyoonia koreensis]